MIHSFVKNKNLVNQEQKTIRFAFIFYFWSDFFSMKFLDAKKRIFKCSIKTFHNFLSLFFFFRPITGNAFRSLCWQQLFYLLACEKKNTEEEKKLFCVFMFKEKKEVVASFHKKKKKRWLFRHETLLRKNKIKFLSKIRKW